MRELVVVVHVQYEQHADNQHELKIFSNVITTRKARSRLDRRAKREAFKIFRPADASDKCTRKKKRKILQKISHTHTHTYTNTHKHLVE